MLTRKHFKAAAENNRKVIEAFSSSKGYSPEQKRMILQVLYRMMYVQAEWMSRENPNFNWSRFLNASGVEPLEEKYFGGNYD